MELFNFRIQSTKLKLQYLISPKQELKRKTIPKKIKILVWETYISRDKRIGKCFCCRKSEITSDDFHSSHVISDNNGGKIEIDNLRPLCSQCNLSMGKDNMYDFINEYNLWK